MKEWSNKALSAAAAIAAAAFLLDWAITTLQPWLPLFAVVAVAMAIIKWRRQ